MLFKTLSDHYTNKILELHKKVFFIFQNKHDYRDCSLIRTALIRKMRLIVIFSIPDHLSALEHVKSLFLID